MLILTLALLIFVLGPTGAIPYALAQGLPALETAVAVSVIHVLLIPVWFVIFSVIKYDDLYQWRLTSQLIKGGKKLGFDLKEIIHEFERRSGQLGFGLVVVGFTFLLGVSWAALGASILIINKRTIFASIAVGAVASTIFWTVAFSGALGFLPSPWVLYIITGLLTLFWILNKKLHERKTVREMYKSLGKLGVEMGRKPKKRRKQRAI
jgi:uncharacterized membrane protein